MDSIVLHEAIATLEATSLVHHHAVEHTLTLHRLTQAILQQEMLATLLLVTDSVALPLHIVGMPNPVPFTRLTAASLARAIQQAVSDETMRKKSSTDYADCSTCPPQTFPARPALLPARIGAAFEYLRLLSPAFPQPSSSHRQRRQRVSWRAPVNRVRRI